MLNLADRYKNLRHFLESVWWVVKTGYPARKLVVIGVTGTDGKTTTSHLIYDILKASGKKVALVSTIGAFINDREIDTGFHVTTPDAKFLQPLIAKIVKKGARYFVLETTSHGLDQYRTLGCNYSIGVLTNITHEHLDYHRTFSNYVRTKAKLLKSSQTSVINRKCYKSVRNLIGRNKEVVLYDEKTLEDKLKKIVLSRFKEPYNLLNATAAVQVGKRLGIEDEHIIKAIRNFTGVEGRMQEIKNNRDIRIIIDFAHTPNALENVLTVLKSQKGKNSKLIAVFGCAGERDVQKRPMMGRISTRLADISVFTAEDPRSEDVIDVINQIKRGAKDRKQRIYEIPDRREAISFAINELAKRGDVVIICGKGHEKSMNYRGVEIPWSDLKVVRRALEYGVNN